MGTFPDHPLIRNIVSSKGSDGHSLAITADGQALSWGDGECSFGYVYCYCKACFFIILAVNLTCTCQHLSVTSVFHCCLYSGNYGKLGHGDTATQKTPKIISALTGKVRTVSMCAVYHYPIYIHVLASLFLQMVMFVACGNRHSAAVTLEGELYTWGEGEHGRLGESWGGLRFDLWSLKLKDVECVIFAHVR